MPGEKANLFGKTLGQLAASRLVLGLGMGGEWATGAALIAGCPIVLKPSSLTPLCAAAFVECLDEAGFPPGVVNMLTGSGSVVGDGIVAHPDVRAISFTGGVDTGRHVYESAAKKMIKVGLELGGKNAIIAMDDANVDLLMDGVMFGAFGTAGQRCTATSRLIVHEKLYDQVVDELLKHGVRPRASTPPGVVRDFLSDLYRYQLRQLRARLVRREIAKRDYAGEVVRLRDRYPLLSLPVRFWTTDH